MSKTDAVTDTPLVICFSPNAIVVGRGGTNQPLFAQIVLRVEEAVLSHSGSIKSVVDTFLKVGEDEGDVSTSAVSLTQPITTSQPSISSASSSPRLLQQSSAPSRWQWPTNVLHMASDELVIVVFPTEWSRELRVRLAKVIFEDLKVSAAVFVCSAVAVGFSVGLGLVRNDAHIALYGHLQQGTDRKIKGTRKQASSSSEDSSSEGDSNSDSEVGDDEANVQRRKSGVSSSVVVKKKQDADAEDNASILRSINKSAECSGGGSGGGSFVTPRPTTAFCVVELHYDRLTCSMVECGSVSRFVSVRLPPASLDNQGTLLGLRANAYSASVGSPSKSPSTAIPLVAQKALCSAANGGCIPSTMSKLEKKVAADRSEAEEVGHTDVDFQVVFALAGEAGSIVGVRDALAQGMKSDSSSPSDSSCHRIMLPTICPPAPSLKLNKDADSSSTQQPALTQHLGATSSLVSHYNSDLSFPAADLHSYVGASLLSTVPDKSLMKAIVSREQYREKGPEIILFKAAI